MKIGLYLKRHSPLIMSCVASVGVAATAVLAVKATPKAVVHLKADSRKKHDGDPYAYTKTEAVKSCWTYYIPAAAVGISTIGCIFGAHVLSRHQQASLISAYTMLDQTYRAYRKKVQELYGEEADAELAEEVALSKADCTATPSKADDQLFLDEISGRYFWKSMVDVVRAEYHLNRNYAIRGEATLNEFYDFLGLPRVDYGDALGWSMYAGESFYGYSFIDFNHEIITPGDEKFNKTFAEDFNYPVEQPSPTEEDLPSIHLITMPFPPTADYLDPAEDWHDPRVFETVDRQAVDFAESATPIVKGGEA